MAARKPATPIIPPMTSYSGLKSTVSIRSSLIRLVWFLFVVRIRTVFVVFLPGRLLFARSLWILLRLIGLRLGFAGSEFEFAIKLVGLSEQTFQAFVDIQLVANRLWRKPQLLKHCQPIHVDQGCGLDRENFHSKVDAAIYDRRKYKNADDKRDRAG